MITIIMVMTTTADNGVDDDDRSQVCLVPVLSCVD